MSICWIAVSVIVPSLVPPAEREVAVDRVEGRDVGDVVGLDLEVVQVGLQAVGAGNPGDGLIVGVHHEVFALAEAEREHAALPPRQGAPAFVALHVEVLGGLASRELLKPHQTPLRCVDQRAELPGPGTVGGQDVTRCGIAVGDRDGQDGACTPGIV